MLSPEPDGPYDTGGGRCYLYVNGTVSMVSDNGGDQFFPSIATDANGVNAYDIYRDGSSIPLASVAGTDF